MLCLRLVVGSGEEEREKRKGLGLDMRTYTSCIRDIV